MYNFARPLPEYIKNVHFFIKATKKHARMQKRNGMLCPCIDYENKIAWDDARVIQSLGQERFYEGVHHMDRTWRDRYYTTL